MGIKPLKIFSGSAHPKLANEIVDCLGVNLGKATAQILPDSETHVIIDEVVRDHDIFIIQPCSVPVNDNLIELLLYIDAFRRASAHSISVLTPYFPYARQERMARGREAISARVVANLIENTGADRVIFVDIHNRAIQGFFNIPVDPISAIPVLSEYFAKPDFRQAAIVSPDVGRAKMAAKYAEKLDLPLVVMHKRRNGFGEVKTTHVVGDIENRIPIVIDDMVASGSVLRQIDALYDKGAVGQVYFAITHPILLPTAIEALDQDDRIARLIVTNTLPIPKDKMRKKIEIVSIAPLLAEIIRRIHLGESISPKLSIF